KAPPKNLILRAEVRWGVCLGRPLHHASSMRGPPPPCLRHSGGAQRRRWLAVVEALRPECSSTATRGRGTMRSMVEGASVSMRAGGRESVLPGQLSPPRQAALAFGQDAVGRLGAVDEGADVDDHRLAHLEPCFERRRGHVGG